MATMVDRLIDSAEALLAAAPGSTAHRRRAVSTAYYALFHALAGLCADYLTQGAGRDSEAYLRVYRALDHGQLKSAFGQSPLKDNKQIKRIGDIAVRLQSERHKADYMPPIPGLFSFDQARELVDLAIEGLVQVNAIGRASADRRLLAVFLLHKSRHP